MARELKLPLHANGWAQALSDARLRSDAVYANAQGYRQFAEGLLQGLYQTGGLGNS